MPGFDIQRLTNVGWDALADALAGGALSFVHLEAGDGSLIANDAGPLDTAEMQGLTALKHFIMQIPITSYSNDGEGQVTLIGTLNSKNVTHSGGFYFRELGVKCTIDGGSEILYSVSNTGPTADFIPDNTSLSVVIETLQVIVKIDRVEGLTVNVVPGGDVTAQNIGLGTVGAGWFRDKIASILNFKRFVKGTFVNITEAADTITIDNTGADTAANIGLPGVGAGWFRDKVAGVLNFKRLIGSGITVTEGSDTITLAVPGMIGMMTDWPAPVIPANWLQCDGTALSRTTYGILFSLLGTTWGIGNGTTTFNIPDIRGRVTIASGQGAGLSNRLLGLLGGLESEALTIAQMPAHTHTGSTAPAHGHPGSAGIDHVHYMNNLAHSHHVSILGMMHPFASQSGSATGVAQINPGGAPPAGDSIVDASTTAGHPADVALAGTFQSTGSNYGTGYSLPVSIAVAGPFALTIASQGGGAVHSLMQPFAVVNKIIRVL